jgi:hypothetical protein
MIATLIGLLALGLGVGLGWWYRGRIDRAFLETVQRELKMIQGIIAAVRDGDLGPGRRPDDSVDAFRSARDSASGVPGPMNRPLAGSPR